MRNKILIGKIVPIVAVFAMMLAPALALGQWVDPATGPDIGAGQTGLASTSIADLILNAMNWLLIIIATFAVIAFVIAGIMYLTAAGNEDQIAKAKTTMMYAIIGILVGLLGLVIVTAVDNYLDNSGARF